MTTSIATRQTAGPRGRSAQQAAPTPRHRSTAPTAAHAPSCSLKARPAPHPGPAPSWEELLGQR